MSKGLQYWKEVIILTKKWRCFVIIMTMSDIILTCYLIFMTQWPGFTDRALIK